MTSWIAQSGGYLDIDAICLKIAATLISSGNDDEVEEHKIAETARGLAEVAHRALDEVTDREIKALRALELAREARGEAPEPVELGIARLIAGARFGMCCSLWEAVLTCGMVVGRARCGGAGDEYRGRKDQADDDENDKDGTTTYEGSWAMSNVMEASSMLIDAIMSFVTCVVCDPELRTTLDIGGIRDSSSSSTSSSSTIQSTNMSPAAATAIKAMMRDHADKLLVDARCQLIGGGAEFVRRAIDAMPAKLLKNALMNKDVHVDVVAAVALAVRRGMYMMKSKRTMMSPASVTALNELSAFMCERRATVRAMHRQGATHRYSLTVLRVVLMVQSNSGLLRLHKELGLA